MERHRPEYEPPRASLDAVTLAEYKELPPDMQEWLVSGEAVPESVREHLGELEPSLTLRETLSRIRTAIEAASEGRHEKPTSFEESRFTSFAEIVERGLDSCGARTRAVGTTLRELGVPVKFIDGMHRKEDGTEHDHAWLEIYAPKTRGWMESDVMTEDLSQDPANRRSKEFHDWEELRAKGR